MKFDPPMLTRGPLSGRVYVVTHGKVIDAEKGHIEATVKYDVTEQFEGLVSGECVAPQSVERGSVERRNRAHDTEVDGSPLTSPCYGLLWADERGFWRSGGLWRDAEVDAARAAFGSWTELIGGRVRRVELVGLMLLAGFEPLGCPCVGTPDEEDCPHA